MLKKTLLEWKENVVRVGQKTFRRLIMKVVGFKTLKVFKPWNFWQEIWYWSRTYEEYEAAGNGLMLVVLKT